jgi:hypothetical protein
MTFEKQCLASLVMIWGLGIVQVGESAEATTADLLGDMWMSARLSLSNALPPKTALSFLRQGLEGQGADDEACVYSLFNSHPGILERRFCKDGIMPWASQAALWNICFRS